MDSTSLFRKKVVIVAAGKNIVKVGWWCWCVRHYSYLLLCYGLITNTIIWVKVLFSYDVAPFSTSVFNKFGEIRFEKSKAKLRKLLQRKYCSKYRQARPCSIGWLCYTIVSAFITYANIICQKLAYPSWSKDFPNVLTVTDQSPTPFKVLLLPILMLLGRLFSTKREDRFSPKIER